MKIGFGLWLTLCFFVCVWFLTSFTKGRRQFQSNLNVIEDGLRRMKDEMESKEEEQEQYNGPEDLERFLEKLEREEEERERVGTYYLAVQLASNYTPEQKNLLQFCMFLTILCHCHPSCFLNAVLDKNHLYSFVFIFWH